MIPQRFLIPFLISVAIHAALLAFGPSPSVVDPARVEKVTYVPLPPLDPLFELPPATAPVEKGGGGGEPVVSLEEPPALPKPTDFVITVPESIATNVSSHLNRIPRMPGPEGPGEFAISGPPIGPIGTEHLDQEPRARARIAPEYPYEAKSRGLEGVVEVAFVVEQDGAVARPRVLRSDHRELENAALRAVGKWRFEPGKYRGRPVAFRMSVPIVFRIADE